MMQNNRNKEQLFVWITTVSYTHLDVYKRQSARSYSRMAASPLSVFAAKVNSMFCALLLVPNVAKLPSVIFMFCPFLSSISVTTEFIITLSFCRCTLQILFFPSFLCII